ncbi:hypothetical protein QVD17_15979 [Tagetes erecta]|uniref:BHLH domain-containing protein n=1 Tax=Tagetes erecta TaxID=13708 RepID=A0AAD8KUA3_TARER|nr:hypothetical protein QVD17_15979 [Tagetes erecta]
MQSSSFHDHQHEDDNQFVVDPSCYELSRYENHILNGTRNNSNSTDASQHVYENINQELQHLARIKNELSVARSYSEPSNIISCSPTSSSEDFMPKNNIQKTRYNNDNNQDMLLTTFSKGCHLQRDIFMNQIPTSFDSFDTCRIFPTLNVSNMNHPTSSFNMNLPALDSFGSATFNGSSSYQPSAFSAHNLGGVFNDNCSTYGVDQMNIKTAPAFIFETKKAASDVKVPKASPTKKSRLESRSSCAPLKIRKEKLGDRISALQQMVAPFGKTDTASVLTEAIGYIKFLQNQVEGSIKDGNYEEMKRDLRSRGLCLVPISCLTYGSVWATL